MMVLQTIALPLGYAAPLEWLLYPMEKTQGDTVAICRHRSRKNRIPVLSDLNSDSHNARDAEPGFLARDILRFIVVDIILTVFVKLFLVMGFFAGTGEYVAGILVGKMLLMAYLVWLIRDRRDAWTATGIAGGGRLWGWLAAFGLYAAYYFAIPRINAANHLIMVRLHHWIGWRYEAAPQDVMFYIFDNILPLPLLLILIGFTVIAGPFMEELAFRGMGYDAYRRTSRIAGAIVWTGLLFGAYHFRVDLILPLGLLGRRPRRGRNAVVPHPHPLLPQWSGPVGDGEGSVTVAASMMRPFHKNTAGLRGDSLLAISPAIQNRVLLFPFQSALRAPRFRGGYSCRAIRWRVAPSERYFAPRR